MIDWKMMKTPDQVSRERVQQEYDAVLARRAEAYRLESDPIKTEVEFDSIRAGCLLYTSPNALPTVEAPLIARPTSVIPMSACACEPVDAIAQGFTAARREPH